MTTITGVDPEVRNFTIEGMVENINAIEEGATALGIGDTVHDLLITARERFTGQTNTRWPGVLHIGAQAVTQAIECVPPQPEIVIDALTQYVQADADLTHDQVLAQFQSPTN